MGETISALSENISRVFRHIFPGILILGGALASHPSWFNWVDLRSESHLLVLAVVAVVAGNTWFVFHRYGIHQIVDYGFYALNFKGPASDKRGGTPVAYVDELAQYVVNAIPSDDTLRQHVALRASSMHLMYIASQVSLLFNLWPESGSFFDENATLMIGIGILGLIITGFQNLITRRIDWYSTNQEDASVTQSEGDGVAPINSVTKLGDRIKGTFAATSSPAPFQLST